MIAQGTDKVAKMMLGEDSVSNAYVGDDPDWAATLTITK